MAALPLLTCAALLASVSTPGVGLGDVHRDGVFEQSLGGGAGVVVVKDASLPVAVPPALLTTIRKWYVVPVLRPESAADSATSLEPEPGSGEQATLDP